MPREVFPYAADRAAVSAFLRGAARFLVSTGPWVWVSQHKLMCGSDTVAWFDSGGSLVGKLAPGQNYHPSHRLLYEVLDQLGIDDRFTFQPHDQVGVMRHFYAGNEVSIGEPVILCGPLSVRAFRSMPAQPVL